MTTDDAKHDFKAAATEIAKVSAETAHELVQGLLSDTKAPPVADIRPLLKALRGARYFETLGALTDWLQRKRVDSALVEHYDAQALVELSRLGKAKTQMRALLQRLEDGKPPPDVTSAEERSRWTSEVLGLLGRTCKQTFVQSGEREDLAEAIGYYERAYALDPAWHGANLVALLHRSGVEGWEASGTGRAREVAERLLRDLHAIPKSERTHWTDAGIGEATLALGKAEFDRALESYARFANHPQVDGFALAAAGRQLREIWRFPGDRGFTSLFASLEAKALTRSGGGTYSAKSLANLAGAMSETLTSGEGGVQEAILGENTQVPVRTIAALLGHAESVCQVLDRNRERKQAPSGGTGFLVDGATWSEEFRGQALLLTNAHVLSETGEWPSVSRQNTDVVLRYRGDGGERRFQVDRILTRDPVPSRDFTIATLRPPPPATWGLELAADPAALGPHDGGGNARLYLIGHPRGRGLEFSLSDNKVLSHDVDRPTRRGYSLIHYRAPTEKGMSGSPVFDEYAETVIGLHRAGGEVAPLWPSLERAEYRANEAVWIRSVFAEPRGRP